MADETTNGNNNDKKDMEIKDNDIVSLGPNIHISKHPVLSHKITILRSSETTPGTFRSVLREVTYHLGYEATSTLSTKQVPVSVSNGKEKASEHISDCMGQKLSDKIALIPILRSGLGMADGMLELLPNTEVFHIGMYHVPGALPIQYFNRLPRTCHSTIAFVLDPVIASAETVMAVVAILKKWGVPKIHVICVLASRQGLTKIKDHHPDIHLTVGVVDDILTDEGIVLPGLGDCGNRLYGTTPIVDDDDEGLLHPSKRKRSAEFLSELK